MVKKKNWNERQIRMLENVFYLMHVKKIVSDKKEKYTICWLIGHNKKKKERYATIVNIKSDS